MSGSTLFSIGEALIDMIPSKVGCSFDEVPSFSPRTGGAPANVCAAFARLGGKSAFLSQLGDDPFGHKIAVRDIHKGELIMKYGEEIGIATKEIKKGEYVHIHNLDSMRGRGDWKE